MKLVPCGWAVSVEYQLDETSALWLGVSVEYQLHETSALWLDSFS